MSKWFDFKIFGITLLSWSVRVEAPPAPPELDREALYQEFAERFTTENKAAWGEDLAKQLSDAVAKMRGGSSNR